MFSVKSLGVVAVLSLFADFQFARLSGIELFFMDKIWNSLSETFRIPFRFYLRKLQYFKITCNLIIHHAINRGRTILRKHMQSQEHA